MAIITATRYHDFSMGHRVVEHEGSCKHLHGHNYRVYFTVVLTENTLDNLGRVIDFSVIKSTLCEWLERNWDHKMVLWEQDPLVNLFLNQTVELGSGKDIFIDSIVSVPFNPTAENIAHYLLTVVGPEKLSMLGGVKLVQVSVEETRKCSAAATLNSSN